MKKFYFLLLLFLSTLQVTVKGQITQFELSLFENYTAAELSTFLISNALTGQPRIFYIQIAPNNIDVFLEGEILWKENSNSAHEKLVSFKTKSFGSRSFFNDEIGTTEILIADSDVNKPALDRNRQVYGKPVGEYLMNVKLYLTETAAQVSETRTGILTFLNPSQTLTIQLPFQNSVQDIGNIYVQWNELPGVEHYVINARIKRSSNYTDEDIITSGFPLVTNQNVGLVNGINLRSIMSREPEFGDEIVLQVSAFVPNPEGGIYLNSNLTRFKINNPLNPANQVLLHKLLNLFALFPVNNLSELLGDLNSNELKLTGIETDGGSITIEELEKILNGFYNNPDNLINISFRKSDE